MARALTPVTVPAGTELIRQGDPGDAYYAIAAGELDATQDGHFLRRCGRGEGVGEIALLRDIPRTTTVVAHTAATVYKLDREPFLTAVLGHAHPAASRPHRRHPARNQRRAIRQHGPADAEVGGAGDELLREGNLVAPGLPGIVYDRRVGGRAGPVSIG